ncbi:hypothetical protein Sjap_025429 [Stephania japonica]|uniref:non-specific serine/threonine protein kinase n=1 Tax=Stephania japonica TaxID=461633 RepID=A0AAP0HE74_9MAGN
MNPKISDFGMARIFGGNNDFAANTKRVVGTYGCMSPEYAVQGLFSVKSDVFSFRVLLLEILSGKKNTFSDSSNTGNLLGYVSKPKVLATPVINIWVSSNQYLGIWYNNIPVQTIVWIANRDDPLSKSSSGLLMLNRKGNLVLMDGTRYVWSSNVSFVNGTANNSVAVLQNSGNLVLRDGAGAVLWQSFDHPTDTLLPGMKIGFSKKTGHNGLLTSWKDENEPRSGDFTIGLDPQRPSQIVIWRDSNPYSRTDLLDGRWIATGMEKSNNSFIYLNYIRSDEGYYVSFGVSDNSIVSRWMLNRTGVIEFLLWQATIMKWTVFWSAPKDECEIYARCGPFGSCDKNNRPGICSCMTGFKPSIQKDWENGDWSGGCVRQKKLKCDDGDGFMRYERMKLPDHSILLGNLTIEECEIQCRRNCSCIAYAPANSSDQVESRCMYWSGNLMDVTHYLNAGRDLFVRLDGSELDGSEKGPLAKSKKSIAIPIATTMAILLIGTLCCFLLVRKFQRPKKRSFIGIRLKDPSESAAFGSHNGSEVNSFSLSSILAATDSFSAVNKLGEGGFGPVYRGTLIDGSEIAVKKLSENSGQGREEFMNEVTLIAKLQHKNLVRLLGCCIQKEEKMLIYEYMPNKSLDKHLFDLSKRVNLDWNLRFHIIEGIAQGILYLHKYSRLKIIHRDLKASNILLDGSMNPKISDFGMARIIGGNQTEANTGRVVGTLGYMSPEYALNGLFSEKSDVFSFGVLLIEIISSKRNTGLYPTEKTPTLLGHAWELWREDRALELMDESIKDSCVPQEILRCIQIGLLCVQEDANARPTMSSIIFMLGNDNATLPSPEQPGFFMKRTSTVVNSVLATALISILGSGITRSRDRQLYG